MGTGVANPDQWMRVFGVDREHVDHLEIVRRGGLVQETDVDKAYEWLMARLGESDLSGKSAPEHIRTQIKHYIATKEIVAEQEMDFVGVKCHYDLREYVVTQCLTAILLNDPYDWDGPKEPTMMACDADNVYVFCNCGSQPSWYAARSDNPDENLAKVRAVPVIPKYAGNGAHFTYVCKEGPFTLALLSRRDGQYRMFLSQGEFLDLPAEKAEATALAWPHGFSRLPVEPGDFFQQFDSNHAHIVPGNHAEAIRFFCRITGIACDET